MRAVWIWKCRVNLFRLPPCRSHPLGPTNTRRLFYRVGRQCTRHYELCQGGATITLADGCAQKENAARLTLRHLLSIRPELIAGWRTSCLKFAVRHRRRQNAIQQTAHSDPGHRMPKPRFFDLVNVSASDQCVPM